MPEIPFHLDAEKIAKQFVESIKKNTGITLQYDVKSIKTLESIIDQLRQLKSKEAEKIVLSAGIWFGECLRALFGGQWHYEEQYKEWGILFTKKELTAFPISKAFKQYKNGLEDSVQGYAIAIKSNLA